MDPEPLRPNGPTPEPARTPADGPPPPSPSPPPPPGPSGAPAALRAAPPPPVVDEDERRRVKAERHPERERHRGREAERLREREREQLEKEARRQRKREKDEREAAKQEEKKERDRRVRGVETLFRTSYLVNMDLSSLADSKANIMVSVNGLILSILIGSLGPALDTNPWLRLPTGVLVLFITLALIFGVLAALPRVESKEITLDQVREGRANLLFFGHFANMSRQDYVVGMEELTQDPPRLYRSMSSDLYGIGTVLQKKYRLLRYSYILFLAGVFIGAAFFIGTFMFATPERVPSPVQVLPSAPAPAGSGESGSLFTPAP